MHALFLVGVFYYTLGNIRPIFRSSLQAIQLASIARSVDITNMVVMSYLNHFLIK